MKEFLMTLLSTLSDIEVKGKANMDKMLGCIIAAERELAKIQSEDSTGEAEEINDGE